MRTRTLPVNIHFRTRRRPRRHLAKLRLTPETSEQHSQNIRFLNMARFEIFGDCRIKFLPDLIAQANYTEARIRVTPSVGTGIRGLVSLAYAHAQARPQDTVFICPGVIDFLTTDQVTGMSSLRYTTVEDLTSHIIGLLNEGDVNYHIAYPESHISFALISGFDIRRYPMTADENGYHQYVINASIQRINEEIVAINERNHLTTPWTTKHVHVIRKNRRGQTYIQNRYHLLSDGYHPTTKLLNYWANALIDAVWRST